jgi:polysaccharide deacetylase 2 family uncharacterized protein YibQ
MTKKTTKRQKTPKKNKQTKSIHYYINLTIVILIVFLLALLVDILYFDTQKDVIKTNQTIKPQKKKNQQQQFEKQTDELQVQYVKTYTPKEDIYPKSKPIFHFEDTIQTQTAKTIKTIIPKIEKIKEKIKVQKITKTIKPIILKPNIIKVIKVKNQKPKLAILIDDIVSKHQVNRANNLPFKVTLSFLPPTSTHKNSAKISQNQTISMIHLPLEAGSKEYEEINTLHIDDSLKTIDNRIKYLKSIYPKVKYLNNHTGSKFTKNLLAMDRLMRTLKKYDYYFVDSKTIAHTKTTKTATKYNVPYLSRDIFLDNTKTSYSIKRQLKKAVKIAKKRGFAIAICHPYPVTYKTLNDVKDILKDVELVYINELKIKSPR